MLKTIENKILDNPNYKKNKIDKMLKTKIINNKKNYKKEFEEQLNDYKFKCKGITDRNLISRFVYRHLGDNINFLPSNIITEIINKSFDGYASYYSLIKKT
jgi:hypothetical protein